jgi:hypothetical protein
MMTTCASCRHLRKTMANGLHICGNDSEPWLFAKVFPAWFGCIKGEE